MVFISSSNVIIPIFIWLPIKYPNQQLINKTNIKYLIFYKILNKNHHKPMHNTQKQSLLSTDRINDAASPHKEQHIEVGEYLKSSVYGGLDGVVNTLTVILGGIAAGTQPSHILAIGISVLIGDGLGMGLGDYLSAKAEKQFIKSEEKRQFWEIEHRLQDEKDEIRQIYVEKGYTQEQSHRISDLYATNGQAFVNIMMLEELGLVVDDSSPFWGGVVTFFAFAIFGLLPLIPYIIGTGFGHDNQTQYTYWAIAIGIFELFSLGYAKAVLVGLNRYISGMESLLLGGFAVGVGYLIGLAFKTD